jgi:hypothetical protein
MSQQPEFYICTVCFETSDSPEHCHVPMIPAYVGEPGDEIRKPLINQKGRIVNPAPRWFLEGKEQISTD